MEEKILYHLETIKFALCFMFFVNISLLCLIVYIVTHNIGV